MGGALTIVGYEPIRLDPLPLIDAVRKGRPWHDNNGCPYCYQGNQMRPPNRHFGLPAMQPSRGCITQLEVAKILGVNPRQIVRWLSGVQIQLNHPKADPYRIYDYAYRAGVHPDALWPELEDLWQ